MFDSSSIVVLATNCSESADIPSFAIIPSSTQPDSFSVPQSLTSSLSPTVSQGHPMITKSKSGIIKPRHPLTLSTSLSLPFTKPSHFSQAISHHVWQKAMAEEYEALVK